MSNIVCPTVNESMRDSKGNQQPKVFSEDTMASIQSRLDELNFYNPPLPDACYLRLGDTVPRMPPTVKKSMPKPSGDELRAKANNAWTQQESKIHLARSVLDGAEMQ